MGFVCITSTPFQVVANGGVDEAVEGYANLPVALSVFSGTVFVVDGDFQHGCREVPSVLLAKRID